MSLNIKKMDFSYYGSYIGFRNVENKLNLNSLRGKSKGNKSSMTFAFDLENNKYDINASFEEISLTKNNDSAHICFMSEKEVMIKVKANNFYINTNPKFNFEYNYLLGNKEDKLIVINSYKNLTKYVIKVINANMELVQDIKYETTGQNNTSNNSSIIKFKADEVFYIIIKEIETNGDKININEVKDYDYYLKNSKKKFEDFVNKIPTINEKRKDAIYLAAYILYSSTVAPSGTLKEYATYASNGDFPYVYSWDNCIISFGLSLIDPKLSLNQMSVFSYVQDEYGQIPGSLGDSTIRWNFSKPPIQGWTLNILMNKMEVSKEDIEKMYFMTKKLTNYYFNFKDSNNDGICEYHHGNDSGQDNSTAFKYQRPIDSPDLQAYLIESFVFLKNVNDKYNFENIDYENKIKQLVDEFVNYYWDGNDMNVYDSFTKEKIDTQGIIKYMGLLLGNKLPENIKEFLIKKVTSQDFLTDYGIATENINSNDYQSDAYWRGPIWAPTTILFYETFKSINRDDIALNIAQKFCSMMEEDMTFAENYEATKGNRLRDHYFGWTAGAYLYLQNELEN